MSNGFFYGSWMARMSYRPISGSRKSVAITVSFDFLTLYCSIVRVFSVNILDCRFPFAGCAV
jgi:hypothetical protein